VFTFDLAQVELLDRIEQEMHQVVRRPPIAQVRGQQQSAVTVEVDQASGHATK
jgi:hypothetical protein